MKQLIIARKDLNMSPGKLAAQVSHASIAFLTNKIKQAAKDKTIDGKMYYITFMPIDTKIYDDWICGSFTKIVCEAKNKYQLEKVINKAKELGMLEGIDYFLIKDNCLTELTSEEIDENGIGRTLTCIGFRPLPDGIVNQLSKKYQLYR